MLNALLGFLEIARFDVAVEFDQHGLVYGRFEPFYNRLGQPITGLAMQLNLQVDRFGGRIVGVREQCARAAEFEHT